MEYDPTLLTSLAAKQEITEQIYRYCRSMDRIDNDLGKSVWHPDGTADFGLEYKGTGAGWIEHASAIHAASFVVHSHMVGNILIELHGDDKATSESYVYAALQTDQDGKRMQADIRGRYLDQWSRRDGRWAIDHRQYVHDFFRMREVDFEGPMAQPWGRRDREDPVYSLARADS